MRVSIFIRARNEASVLGQTLDAFASQVRSPDEVVVLDNASEDQTAAVARSRGAMVATIRRDMFSYGRALNRALDETSGSIIVFLSAHSPPVDARWLASLIAPIEAGEADATFGRQVPVPGVNRLEEWIVLRTFPRRPSRLLSALGVQKVTFSNANAAVARQWLQRERFREDLAFAEDIEWQERAAANGARVGYCPAAAVWHSHALDPAGVESRMTNVGRAMRQRGGGAVYRNRWTCMAMMAATAAVDTGYCLCRGDVRALGRIVAYRSAYFRGLRRGVNEP